MDRESLLTWAAVLSVPTLIQVMPIKINPWSCIWKMLKWIWHSFCRSLNADVLAQLSQIQEQQKDTQKKLEDHIKLDNEREADKVRASILQFNNELLREIPHTKEEFVEVLSKIDWYNAFCEENKDYRNSRAVHAIANIERVYDERLQKHDFL